MLLPSLNFLQQVSPSSLLAAVPDETGLIRRSSSRVPPPSVLCLHCYFVQLNCPMSTVMCRRTVMSTHARCLTKCQQAGVAVTGKNILHKVCSFYSICRSFHGHATSGQTILSSDGSIRESCLVDNSCNATSYVD